MKMVGHKIEAIYRRYAIVAHADLVEASRKLNLLTGRVTGTIARAVNELPKISVRKLNRGRSLDGAEGQNRTADTVIFSHVLYQLSYLGTRGRVRRRRARPALSAGRLGRPKTPDYIT